MHKFGHKHKVTPEYILNIVGYHSIFMRAKSLAAHLKQNGTTL